MIKAVIFDMDGVLSDTDKTRFHLLKILLKERGIVLQDSEYKRSVGKRTENFLKDLFGHVLTEDDIREIFRVRKEMYTKEPDKYILPQPGVYSCCKTLHDAGFILAIASMTSETGIKIVLRHLKLLSFFTVFVGSDNIVHLKPHPEIYNTCVSQLQMSKTQCVAIEDSPTGIRAAKAAGLMCIGITQTHAAGELDEADKIISSLHELTPEYINTLA